MKDRSNVKGIEKHIRIADSETNAQIDKVMLLTEYKSFNKVINDALFYGLPILCEKLFGKEEAQDEQLADVNVQSENDMAERLDGIEKLLHETILNVTINKSLLSSLFNAKILERKGMTVKSDFDRGLLADTPDYLYEYELDEIKKLNGSKKK